MNTLQELLHDELKDLYSAEQQLTKALPRMARGAASPQLREAIEDHLRVTEEQVKRLEQVAERMDITLRGKKCKGMEGLIEEGKEILTEKGDENVLDAAIIAAAQRVEHYEISGYGSARALAERLDLPEVVELLQTTLDEEAAADKKLTEISEQIVLPASATTEMEGEDEEETEATARDGRRGGATAARGRGAKGEPSRRHT